MPSNPMSDDLRSAWTKRKRGFSEPTGKRRDATPSDPDATPAYTGRTETYAEKDEQHYRLIALYGEQEKPKRMRRGRVAGPGDAA